jgi:hypothetical protein
MYLLHQELTANPEGRSTGGAGYLFSRFYGWRPMIVGDVLVCGHDGGSGTCLPSSRSPPQEDHRGSPRQPLTSSNTTG